jgi:methyl-accepting chemotaxis protein
MNLKNFKISTRLYLAIAVLIASIVGVVATAITLMETMRQSSSEITERWLPGVQAANQMSTAISNVRLNSLQHIFADGPAKAILEKRMQKSLDDFMAAQKLFAAQVLSADEKKKLELLNSSFDKYIKLHKQIIDLSRQYINNPAQKLYEGDSRAAYDTTVELLDGFIEVNRQGSASATKGSEDAFAAAKVMMGISLLAALILAALSSMWLIRSITTPLNQAVKVAKSVAEGNLTMTIDTSSEDEIGLLLKSLAQMQDGLAEMVRAVRDSAHSLASDSETIARRNNELSSRTGQQASALEETAASMEELNSSVSNNAENARTASELANQASGLAIEGGQVVESVVSNMKGVNESAKQISEIIQVIDGIAFQTNILALNAAVEAARAGDQGRGFAVVASEVRNLAVRSADAAKQIKQLINASVARIESGSTLVDRAGSTMGNIVASIQKVSSIVREISIASVEQSQGVAQIGEAISHMDQSTQMNAALVEEMADASGGFSQQAQDLVKTVSIFNITEAGPDYREALIPSNANSENVKPYKLAAAQLLGSSA